MKLAVKGVEEIEITDPNKVCGTRKKLDPALLKKIRGQDFTSTDLKRMFGYAETTALCDTQLARHVEMAKKLKNPAKKIHWGPEHFSMGRSDERSIRWRVI